MLKTKPIFHLSFLIAIASCSLQLRAMIEEKKLSKTPAPSLSVAERSAQERRQHDDSSDCEEMGDSLENNEISERDEVLSPSLEDFKEIVANNPEAVRLILVQEGDRVVLGIRENINNHSDQNDAANRAIMRMLKDLITTRYSEEIANAIPKLNPMAFARAEALSAATVAEILNGLPLEEHSEPLPAKNSKLTNTKPNAIAPPTFDSFFTSPTFLEEKEKLAPTIQQLVRESFRNQIATYPQRHSDYYTSADAAWKKHLQSWHERTKAQRKKQDAITLLERAEQLLKTAQEAKRNPQETFLGKVAQYTGKAAAPLSYIPGPIPLGGIAHTISELAEKINQALINLDENVAATAVEAAKDNKIKAAKEAEEAGAKVATAYQGAQEKEAQMSIQEESLRREMAFSLQPPIMSFEEKAWQAWAEKILHLSKKKDSHLATQIAEHGMIDPAGPLIQSMLPGIGKR